MHEARKKFTKIVNFDRRQPSSAAMYFVGIQPWRDRLVPGMLDMQGFSSFALSKPGHFDHRSAERGDPLSGGAVGSNRGKGGVPTAKWPSRSSKESF